MMDDHLSFELILSQNTRDIFNLSRPKLTSSTEFCIPDIKSFIYEFKAWSSMIPDDNLLFRPHSRLRIPVVLIWSVVSRVSLTFKVPPGA
jgi:hypothetical protein